MAGYSMKVGLSLYYKAIKTCANYEQRKWSW